MIKRQTFKAFNLLTFDIYLPPMLKAIDVHKSYNSLHVLRGINLEIPDHEIISIVGASGAGKSTLLHILGTLDTPDRGQLIIDNKELFKLKN